MRIVKIRNDIAVKSKLLLSKLDVSKEWYQIENIRKY